MILNLGESYNRINLEKLMKQKELLKSEQAKYDLIYQPNRAQANKSENYVSKIQKLKTAQQLLKGNMSCRNQTPIFAEGKDLLFDGIVSETSGGLGLGDKKLANQSLQGLTKVIKSEYYLPVRHLSSAGLQNPSDASVGLKGKPQKPELEQRSWLNPNCNSSLAMPVEKELVSPKLPQKKRISRKRRVNNSQLFSPG